MEYPGGNYRGGGVYQAVATVPRILKLLPHLETIEDTLQQPMAVPQPTPEPRLAEQPSHSHARTHRAHPETHRIHVKRRVLGGLMTATLALLSGHPAHNEAVRPQAEAVDMVEDLLMRPDVPYTTDPTQKDTGYPAGDIDAEFAHNQLIYARRNAIAAKNSLNVFDGSQLIRSLQQKKDGWYTLTADEARVQTEKFLAQYGVALPRTHDDVQLDFNLQDAAEEYLSTDSARATLVQLVRDFAATPKQYFELAGIQRIILAMPSDDGSNRAAYTEGEFTKGNYIVINVNGRGQQVIAHELAHRINGRITPDKDDFTHNPSFLKAAGDPAYGTPFTAGKNQPDNVPGNSNGYITLNQFNYLYKAKRAEVFAQANTADCATTARNAAELLTSQATEVDFNSSYADATEAEQQAEIDAPIANGDRPSQEVAELSAYDFNTITSPYFPRLRAQFIHELARLASANAVGRRIVTYFLQAAYKHRAADPAADMYHMCEK